MVDEDTSWLTPSEAGVIVSLGGDADDEAFIEHLAGARSWVESQRQDLVTTVDDVTEFRPTQQVRLGTAMLAHRWYLRRRSPLGVTVGATEGSGEILRYDPDIAQMLGTGGSGAFVFGGARR